jgi:VWFA-related protein
MKLSVAFLLVLTTFSSGAVTQTPSRRPSQSAVSKPRSETIRICQGVAIPDGYVIIAYTTSSACPHGAYVLRKQADYESSIAVNNSARQPSDASSTATRTMSTESSGSLSQLSQDPAKAQGASAAATRARRVGSLAQKTTQSQVGESAPEGPPSLIGTAAPGPSRPPTLTDTRGASSPPLTIPSSDAAIPTGPEEVSEGDVIRVNTTLVTVPVSVLDRQGRFVPNLKREDFKVFENGVEQSIAYFEPAEKPFTVALLLDTSPSTHFHLSEIKEAAIEFAKRLRPQDRVLIVSFNDEVLLLTEVTNDLNTIEAVIQQNANTGNSTRLYDAVDLTIREQLNKIKGRKAIVLFSDGVDTSSRQATYNSSLDEVEELDALIYTIQYDTTDYLRAMQNPGSGTVTVVTTRRGPFGKTTSQQTYNTSLNGGLPIPGTSKEDYDRADRYLHALADKTGGRLYEANDTDQLAQAFTRIAEELRRQYSLGYYPKNDSGDGSGRRELRVKVGQPNLAVKARASYMKSSASPDKR